MVAISDRRMPTGHLLGCGPRGSEHRSEPAAEWKHPAGMQRTSTSTSRCSPSGQTGVQTSCAARAEVTAIVGSGDQHDLRLLSHNGVACQNLCVCIGGVGIEQVARKPEPCQRRKRPVPLPSSRLRPCRQAAGRKLPVPMSSASLRTSEISSSTVGCSSPWRCSQNTHTPEKSARFVLLKSAIVQYSPSD